MVRSIAVTTLTLFAGLSLENLGRASFAGAADWIEDGGAAGPPVETADSAGAPPPFPWPDQARLFGSDQMLFWSFGRDVALDGDTAVVGASGADIGGNTDQGAAYVFVRQGDEWMEQAQLVAADGTPNEWFGWSVAVRGDTVAVGARLANIDGELDQGAVYVFDRVGEGWMQMQKLVASDGDELDYLGYSLAMADETLVVGARGADDRGAAYVFVKQGSFWVEEAKLFDPEAQAGAGFGHDAALQGDTALLGASNAFIDGDAGRGAAYVYTRTGRSWDLEQQLLASDGDQPDHFGTAVALDRDMALIGADQKIIDGNPRQGAAYIFGRSGASWTEEQRLTASDGQAEGSFGIGAALKDGVALVGAEFDFPGEPERGVVYEFREQGGTWVEIQKFAAPEGNGLDSFGRAIALTADGVLISQKDEIVLPPPGGSAWIFGRPTLFEDGFESGDTSAWSQTAQ